MFKNLKDKINPLETNNNKKISTNEDNGNSLKQSSRFSSLSSIVSDVGGVFSKAMSAQQVQPNAKSLQPHYNPANSISEYEDSIASDIATTTKEDLYQRYQKTLLIAKRYKTRYLELSESYQHLEQNNSKLTQTLTETQDRSIRRCDEMKQEMELEKKSKHDVEENYVFMLEEKAEKINILQLQVSLLKEGKDLPPELEAKIRENHEKEIEIEKKKEDDIKELKNTLSQRENLLHRCKEKINTLNTQLSELKMKYSNLEDQSISGISYNEQFEQDLEKQKQNYTQSLEKIENEHRQSIEILRQKFENQQKENENSLDTELKEKISKLKHLNESLEEQVSIKSNIIEDLMKNEKGVDNSTSSINYSQMIMKCKMILEKESHGESKELIEKLLNILNTCEAAMENVSSSYEETTSVFTVQFNEEDVKEIVEENREQNEKMNESQEQIRFLTNKIGNLQQSQESYQVEVDEQVRGLEEQLKLEKEKQKKNIDQFKSKIDELQFEIQEKSNANMDLEKIRANLQEDLKKSAEQINGLREEKDCLSEKMNDLTVMVSDLENELTSIKNKHDTDVLKIKEMEELIQVMQVEKDPLDIELEKIRSDNRTMSDKIDELTSINGQLEGQLVKSQNELSEKSTNNENSNNTELNLINLEQQRQLETQLDEFRKEMEMKYKETTATLLEKDKCINEKDNLLQERTTSLDQMKLDNEKLNVNVEELQQQIIAKDETIATVTEELDLLKKSNESLSVIVENKDKREAETQQQIETNQIELAELNKELLESQQVIADLKLENEQCNIKIKEELATEHNLETETILQSVVLQKESFSQQERTFNDEISVLKQGLSDLQTEKGELEKELNSLQSLVKEKVDSEQKLTEELKKSQEKSDLDGTLREDFTKLKSQHQEKEETLEHLTKEKEILEENLKIELNHLKEIIEEKESAEVKLKEEITNLESSIKEKEVIEGNLKEIIRGKDDAEVNLKEDVTKLENIIKDKEETEMNFKEELNQLKEIIREKDDNEGKLKEEIKEFEDRTQKNEETENSLKEELKNSKKLIEEKENTEMKLKDDLKIFEDLIRENKKRDSNLNTQLNQLNAFILEKENVQMKLKEELETIQKLFNEQEEICQTQKTELDELRKNVETLQNKESDTVAVEERCKAEIDKQQKLEEQLETYEKSINENKQDIEKLTNKIAELQQDLLDKEEIIKNWLVILETLEVALLNEGEYEEGQSDSLLNNLNEKHTDQKLTQLFKLVFQKFLNYQSNKTTIIGEMKQLTATLDKIKVAVRKLSDCFEINLENNENIDEVVDNIYNNIDKFFQSKLNTVLNNYNYEFGDINLGFDDRVHQIMRDRGDLNDKLTKSLQDKTSLESKLDKLNVAFIQYIKQIVEILGLPEMNYENRSFKKQLLKNIKEFVNKKSNIDEEMACLKTDLNETRERLLQSTEATSQAQNELDTERMSLNGARVELNQAIERLNEVVDEKGKIDEEKQSLKKQLNSVSDKISELKQGFHDQCDEKERLQQRIDECLERINANQEALNVTSNELDKYKKMKTDLEEQVQKLQTTNDAILLEKTKENNRKMNVVLNQNEDLVKLNGVYKDEIEKLNIQLEENDQIDSRLRELESTNEELKTAAEKGEVVRRELESANEELKTAAEKGEVVRRELESANEELKQSMEKECVLRRDAEFAIEELKLSYEKEGVMCRQLESESLDRGKEIEEWKLKASNFVDENKSTKEELSKTKQKMNKIQKELDESKSNLSRQKMKSETLELELEELKGQLTMEKMNMKREFDDEKETLENNFNLKIKKMMKEFNETIIQKEKEFQKTFEEALDKRRQDENRIRSDFKLDIDNINHNIIDLEMDKSKLLEQVSENETLIKKLEKSREDVQQISNQQIEQLEKNKCVIDKLLAEIEELKSANQQIESSIKSTVQTVDMCSYCEDTQYNSVGMKDHEILQMHCKDIEDQLRKLQAENTELKNKDAAFVSPLASSMSPHQQSNIVPTVLPHLFHKQPSLQQQDSFNHDSSIRSFNNSTSEYQFCPYPITDSTDYEYLRQILLKYMTGLETETLAKVVATVMNFNHDDYEKILLFEQERKKMIRLLP